MLLLYYDCFFEDGVSSWMSVCKVCNEKGVDLMVVRDMEDLNGLLFMYYIMGEFCCRFLFLVL